MECWIKAWPTMTTKNWQKAKDQTQLSHLLYIYNAHAYLNASPCSSISAQPLPPCQARNAWGRRGGGHWPFLPSVSPWFLREISGAEELGVSREANCWSCLGNILDRDQVWNTQVLNFMLYSSNLVDFFMLYWFGDYSKMWSPCNCCTAVLYYGVCHYA